MNAFYISLYVLTQMGLGFYLSKFIQDEKDFFLGGRNIPTFAIAFSIFATWFGAETCIGSSGAVFTGGLSASKAEPFGYGLCLLLTALYIAPKIWNENYTTMGDFIKDKHGELAEKIFIWIVIPSSLFWAAAQIRAFGQVLTVTTEIDIFWGITISTGFVIVYTLFGGFLGDVVTDVLQGGILALSLLGIAFFALNSNEMSIWAIDSTQLTLVQPEESWLERIDSWLIPILGSLVAQELIARVLSAKNKHQAVTASLGGTGLYLFFGSIPILIGLLGQQLSLEITDTEQFLPTIAHRLLPQWMYILFTGALISAILSTIDSILLAISALVSHNFLVPLLQITDNKRKVQLARLVVVCSGIIAYITALYGESVYEMVEMASSFGSTGILVVVVAGLVCTHSFPWLSIATMIGGVILSIILDMYLGISTAFTINLCILGILYTFFYMWNKHR